MFAATCAGFAVDAQVAGELIDRIRLFESPVAELGHHMNTQDFLFYSVSLECSIHI